MRARTLPSWLTILLVAVPMAADEASTTLVARAIAAHGGEAGLAAWGNLHLRGEATLMFGPRETSGKLEVAVREGRMLRRSSRVEFRGAKREFTSASTGKSAWRRFGSRVYDLPVDDFDDWLRHQPTLLLEAASSPDALTLVGDQDLDGTAVAVVDFARGNGTVRIALDADSSRVRSLEYKTMTNSGMGAQEEAFVKRIYGDYREVGGVPFPHLLVEHADGAERSRLVVTEVELGAPPPIALFAKPEPDPLAKEWGDQIAN